MMSLHCNMIMTSMKLLLIMDLVVLMVRGITLATGSLLTHLGADFISG